MAETSLPWGSTTVGDAGPYSDDDWSELYKHLVLGGAYANSGVVHGSDTVTPYRRGLEVISTGALSVQVYSGSALVDGTMYINSASETLAVPSNSSGFSRRDTIILRKSVASQIVRLAVLPGTAGISNVAAALTQTPTVWEIPLAEVIVANGAVTIAATDIFQTAAPVNQSDGVFLYGVLNNAGQILRTGDVVVWDKALDRTVTTTTTLGDTDIAGVWVGRAAHGERGYVQISGIGVVRVTPGSMARGTKLSAGTTARVANSGGANPFATIIELTSSAFPLCLIDVQTANVPTGAIFDWPVAAVPSGYLLCNGQAVSRTAFSSLFNVIGTTWGVGDGSTTFNVPDFRERFRLGIGLMGGTAPAGRVADPNADILGGAGGIEEHTLLLTEIPPHTHTYQFPLADTVSLGAGASYPGKTHSAIASGSAGGGLPHENMPPWVALPVIIKT